MAKSATLPKNDNPAAPMPGPALSEARAAAISKLMRDGYGTGADGKPRKVRSVEHAIFLANAGDVDLPD